MEVCGLGSPVVGTGDSGDSLCIGFHPGCCYSENLEDCVWTRVKMELQMEEFPLNLYRVQAEPAPSAAGIRPFQG